MVYTPKTPAEGQPVPQIGEYFGVPIYEHNPDEGALSNASWLLTSEILFGAYLNDQFAALNDLFFAAIGIQSSFTAAIRGSYATQNIRRRFASMAKQAAERLMASTGNLPDEGKDIQQKFLFTTEGEKVEFFEELQARNVAKRMSESVLSVYS